MPGEQLVQLLTIDSHTGILDAYTVFLKRDNRVNDGLPVGGQPVFGGEVDFDQLNVQSRGNKLLQDALESDLCHFIAMQYDQGPGNLDFTAHWISRRCSARCRLARDVGGIIKIQYDKGFRRLIIRRL